jgi:hypothetical protein
MCLSECFNDVRCDMVSMRVYFIEILQDNREVAAMCFLRSHHGI